MNRKPSTANLFTKILNVLLTLQILAFPIALITYLQDIDKGVVWAGLPGSLPYVWLGILNILVTAFYLIYQTESGVTSRAFKLSKLTLRLIGANVMLGICWFLTFTLYG